MNESMLVAVIQTSLDFGAAWIDAGRGDWRSCVQISDSEEMRALAEIRYFLASLKGLEQRPDIILLPELSVPGGYTGNLKKTSESLESIIIAGLDYRILEGEGNPSVSNEAVIIVPRRLKGKQISQRTEMRRIGKTYPAPEERKKLSSITGGGVVFVPKPEVWLFNSEDLGDFAVAICYDFMDIDRIALYRGKIQTLFILAYNRDTTSFDHLAEAIARMVFCNVVVCNCGLYGGSLAVSPFKEPFRRTIYKHSGHNLTNAQLIELPLASLKSQQDGTASGNTLFKSLPPGFPSAATLKVKVDPVIA